VVIAGNPMKEPLTGCVERPFHAGHTDGAFGQYHNVNVMGRHYPGYPGVEGFAVKVPEQETEHRMAWLIRPSYATAPGYSSL
jgi:hypothetical protein